MRICRRVFTQSMSMWVDEELRNNTFLCLGLIFAILYFKRMYEHAEHAHNANFAENTSKVTVKLYKINFSSGCKLPTRVCFDSVISRSRNPHTGAP